MLQRTQLMLDSQLKADLAMLAEHKNQSMSQLVREFVAERVKKEKKTLKTAKKMSSAESLLHMIKLSKTITFTGPHDLSESHDTYLY